ncbi:MAG: hypothetical protein Q8R18_01750 [bacterium]|nr:hypothetical protein [bacterium]
MAVEKSIPLGDQEKKVLGYIKDYESKGYSDAKIKEALTKSGVSQEMITKCMKVVHPSNFLKKPLFWVGLLILLGLLLAGIFFFSGEKEVDCLSDRDCGRGYSCSSGDCVLEEDFIEEGIVLEDEEQLVVFGGECDYYSDCGYGETCENGNCVDFYCGTDEECEEEFSTNYGCSFNVCVKKGAAESSGGITSSNDSSGSSSSGSTDTSGSSGSGISSVIEILCSDGLDNNEDGSIDSTGGCDVDADKVLDYVCGCYIVDTETFTSYEDCTLEPLECNSLCDSATELYGCENLDTDIIDASQTCTGLALMSSGSLYYSADSDCASSGVSVVDAGDVSCGSGYVCEGAYACDIANEICYNSCTEEGQCNDGYICDVTTSICEEEDIEVETNCTGDIDDDSDGYVDCADSDCDKIDGCEYGTEVTCDDGADNDGNGDADCDDSDCASDCVIPEVEDVCTDVLPTCADGIDNDGDGDVDIADGECSDWGDEELGIECIVDADCEVTESCDEDGSCVEICPVGFFDNAFYNSNEKGNYSHIDGDEDGIVFCLDADEICHETDGGKNYTLPGITTGQAYYTNKNVPYDYEDSCVTDADNMNQPKDSSNTLREYYCDDFLVTYEAVSCTCENDACVSEDEVVPTTETNCSDGSDDDGDKDIDCDDSDCSGIESSEELCDDEIDNDCDGAVDCADGDCSSACAEDDDSENTDTPNLWNFFGKKKLVSECDDKNDCVALYSDCWNCKSGICTEDISGDDPDCDEIVTEEGEKPAQQAPEKEKDVWNRFWSFLIKGYSSIAETDKYKAPERSSLEYLRDY